MPRRPTPTPREMFRPDLVASVAPDAIPDIDINAELAAGVREVEQGREIAPDEQFVLACNRCNAERPRDVHPCPECRCPEYRILPVAVGEPRP